MLPTPILKDLDYDNVYEPSEDSFLLLDCFEDENTFLSQKFGIGSPIITEIGTGSGIVTSFLMKNILPNGFYVATDVNPHACVSSINTIRLNNPDSAKIDVCQMSLTTAILPHTIDILIFNPPYVPAEEVPEIPQQYRDSRWLDLALLGGSDGMEVTWQLLDSLDSIISETGLAYILFCARNKPDLVKLEMEKRMWVVDKIIERKAGWEVLSVLRFMKRKN
ncbi:S-adenosylmethionine-dependent methyltransferase [Yamadazyma tenuis]|uniref:S-adenosyl-L-methionine-dependent methyltransferase n=1 Tax=Candida tenuis (strain ATCC 10573 / BCRC 21748 / CBS 615 / JCM 9827 / NBRC 10315 / NRRL Y-1498 / VKM Y-70) TaxID=590646 RepID=G3B9Z6_CANTC|nr:S-adenosyl-L-methionine-dependent methyltransferase [Yamadazyma tenuis ATCC 10573]EGV61362.1 S-adenosyl-L-methionine-dependent methyltransferase [Yamadazyma tenuis ATCC 10573]WEJ92576.1 S-adenosylmethionine-dependent methyltransferase [Yamadazyma tenuis]